MHRILITWIVLHVSDVYSPYVYWMATSASKTGEAYASLLSCFPCWPSSSTRGARLGALWRIPYEYFKKWSSVHKSWSCFLGSHDVVEGNTKLILGLVWCLIQRYQIAAHSKIPPKKLVMAWLQVRFLLQFNAAAVNQRISDKFHPF